MTTRFGHAAGLVGIALLILTTLWPFGRAGAQSADLSEIGTDTRRALFVETTIRSDGTADHVEAYVADVPPGTNIADPPQLLLEYFDGDSQLIDQRNAWDPRWEFYESEEGGEAQETVAEAEGTFSIPFDLRIENVKITDQATDMLPSINC